MIGNGWTTLCPATAGDHNKTEFAVFPVGSVGSRKGWGGIIFDTYMDVSSWANLAVYKQIGTCVINDRIWFGNEIGKFGIGFPFDNTTGGYADMRANARLCRNAPAGLNRALDGNGIAPNGDVQPPANDDVTWSFTK